MDDNNSKSIDFQEFSKAMRDYGLGFQPDEMKGMYAIFDINKDGSIDYDEFLRQIRGPMNARRRKLSMQAFNKLDKDGSGIIELEDIQGVYNAKFHPDVASGKKTEDDVLKEFLQTFEMHHNVLQGK